MYSSLNLAQAIIKMREKKTFLAPKELAVWIRRQVNSKQFLGSTVSAVRGEWETHKGRVG